MKYTEFVKLAFNTEKQLNKLQGELSDYDKYRELTKDVPEDTFVNDHVAQSRASDLESRVQGLREWSAQNMDTGGADVVAQLAKMLAASKYYGQDEALLGRMREARQQRLFRNARLVLGF